MKLVRAFSGHYDYFHILPFSIEIILNHYFIFILWWWWGWMVG